MHDKVESCSKFKANVHGDPIELLKAIKQHEDLVHMAIIPEISRLEEEIRKEQEILKMLSLERKMVNTVHVNHQ